MWPSGSYTLPLQKTGQVIHQLCITAGGIREGMDRQANPLQMSKAEFLSNDSEYQVKNRDY